MQLSRSPIPLIGTGLYTPSEASRYTGIPAADIRRWLFGYSVKGVQYPRLWMSAMAELNEHTLGFQDLLEIRFVHAFRQHGVSLQAIRNASRQASRMFNQAYPFTCKRFQTDGRDIFATLLSDTGDESLLDLVKKQYAFEQVIKPSLYEGIDYNIAGAAQCWYPVRHSQTIVLDPCHNFGKPILSAFGIDTSVIFSAYQAEGADARRVAQLYEIPVTAVEAAIDYEHRKAA